MQLGKNEARIGNPEPFAKGGVLAPWDSTAIFFIFPYFALCCYHYFICYQLVDGLHRLSGKR
jgi:hypothetical protein